MMVKSFPVTVFVLNLFVLLEIVNVAAAFVFKAGIALPTLPALLPTQPFRGRYSVTTTKTPQVKAEEVTFSIPEHVSTTTATTTTTTVKPNIVSIQEGLASKIFDKLKAIMMKVDQLQKDMENTQLSLTKQNKAIEALESQAEELWSNLSSQMDDGFKHLSQSTLATTTSNPLEPLISSTEPFDVDIRSRLLLTNDTAEIDNHDSTPNSLSSFSGSSKNSSQLPLINLVTNLTDKTREEQPSSTSEASADAFNFENDDVDIQNL